jgi:hypothetical protein
MSAALAEGERQPIRLTIANMQAQENNNLLNLLSPNASDEKISLCF